MKLFLHGHATHPDAHMALALAAAQIEAQRRHSGAATRPTLGWLYLSDQFSSAAQGLLDDARRRWPGVAWVGAAGVGVSGNGVEYFEEPAVSLMLAEMPREQFRVFSGLRPLNAGDGFTPAAAQVHADPTSVDLDELVTDLAARTSSGYLFGGLASASRPPNALQVADGVFAGGLSGVAFGEGVAMLSRVTQGCQPVGPSRRITDAQRNVIFSLDGEPALACLMRDLGHAGREPRDFLPQIAQTLVGLDDEGDPPGRRGQFGPDTRVRHLVGLDPARGGVAIADTATSGTQLAFCQRHREAARRDLVRICSEIREELEPETQALETALALRDAQADSAAHAARGIAGAVYISCAGRGGPHFGGPSAELQIVRHALGDVPLVGFFASGEIARDRLVGYTGVLTVFPA